MELISSCQDRVRERSQAATNALVVAESGYASIDVLNLLCSMAVDPEVCQHYILFQLSLLNMLQKAESVARLNAQHDFSRFCFDADRHQQRNHVSVVQVMLRFMKLSQA